LNFKVLSAATKCCPWQFAFKTHSKLIVEQKGRIYQIGFFSMSHLVLSDGSKICTDFQFQVGQKYKNTQNRVLDQTESLWTLKIGMYQATSIKAPIKKG
jgi:hypothetical protein